MSKSSGAQTVMGEKAMAMGMDIVEEQTCLGRVYDVDMQDGGRNSRFIAKRDRMMEMEGSGDGGRGRGRDDRVGCEGMVEGRWEGVGWRDGWGDLRE